MANKNTSWGDVSRWYSDHLEKGGDTYQSKVILPNILRLMNIKNGDKILDLACGQGFFSREFGKIGAIVTGVDISKELISEAVRLSPPNTHYIPSSADNLSLVSSSSIDKVVSILAIQNILPAKKMVEECNRVLKSNGKFYIVMNHPAFRMPKESSWGWDDKTKSMYREINSYLSEWHEEISMHPGKDKKSATLSFHRPLQWYFKLFFGNGFAVSRLEEWISHKKSKVGPRQKEEDRMRKEIPLFLALELVKFNG